MTEELNNKMHYAISVIIPTLNEEKNIANCIKSLRGYFAEILVIDSGSNDKTCEIAISLGAKVVEFSWNGIFPKKRNWTLRNIKLINDWVLFLDADEFLTEEFLNELGDRVNQDIYSGYWLNYENYFFSKKIRYGIPFKKLALFNKKKGEYEKIERDLWSGLDMEVHEHPIIDGNVGEIRAKIIHRDYKNFFHYLEKHNKYSSWEAHRYVSLNSDEFQQFTFRQKIKYRTLNSWFLPIIFFLYSYIIKLGFLDGRAGFILNFSKLIYLFQIKCKIIEISEKDESN